MSRLKIGWAEKSITPDKKIYLTGQFFDRVSEYVETPITATAMAVETENDAVVFVSCDLTGINARMVKNVRENIRKKNIGLNPDNIIVNATHTHTSHTYYMSPGSSLALLDRFLPGGDKRETAAIPPEIMDPTAAGDFITERVTEAVLEAWDKRENAYCANEFGRAVIGHCRRAVYDDGSAKMYGDTHTPNFYKLEGPQDTGVELIYVFNEEKKPTGVVVNIACPSQVVEHRSFISSDYWGKARIILREKFGDDFKVLALGGAGGDQAPRELIRWRNPLSPIEDPNIDRDCDIPRKADPSMFDVEGTWELGKRVANCVCDRYDAAVSEMTGAFELTHKKLALDLPIRMVTETDYNEAKATFEKATAHFDESNPYSPKDRAMLYNCCGTMARYELQKNMSIRTIEVHVLRFGDIALATCPFELFINYGYRIKANSPALQTFIVQLCCESAGYLPTEEAEKGDHYSAFVASGIIGHIGGDMLVKEILTEIKKLWQK